MREGLHAIFVCGAGRNVVDSYFVDCNRDGVPATGMEYQNANHPLLTESCIISCADKHTYKGKATVQPIGWHHLWSIMMGALKDYYPRK